jgi:acyl transferase domain-containing protein
MAHQTTRLENEIAIIGMACRFPGGANNPELLFENLIAGKSASGEFPPDRLNIEGFYHPSPKRQDSVSCHGGHLLHLD